MRAVKTMAAAGGAVVIDDKNQVPRRAQGDGALTASSSSSATGFYGSSRATADRGRRIAENSIDVLTAQPRRVVVKHGATAPSRRSKEVSRGEGG